MLEIAHRNCKATFQFSKLLSTPLWACFQHPQWCLFLRPFNHACLSHGRGLRSDGQCGSPSWLFSRGAGSAVYRRAPAPGGDDALWLLTGLGRPARLPAEGPAPAGEGTADKGRLSPLRISRRTVPGERNSHSQHRKREGRAGHVAWDRARWRRARGSAVVALYWLGSGASRCRVGAEC